MKILFCLLLAIISFLNAGKINLHTTDGIIEIEIDDFIKMELIENTVSQDNMILVEGGIFQMGDEIGDLWEGCRPIHQVTLKSFYIGVSEVTQFEWENVMLGNNNDIWETPSHPSHGIGITHPVNRISWYDILVFCNRKSMIDGLDPVYTINDSKNPDDWGESPTSNNPNWDAVICNWTGNGYRLPTEAEWEYAARGGSEDNPTIYAGSDDIEVVAWYASNSDNSCHPVKSKSSNELGLYDMSGNISEWTWDWLGYYSDDPQSNPYGPTNGNYRTFRGGCWFYTDSGVRVSYRDFNLPRCRNGTVGFRIARSN
ncbi:MAG: SUMF1/EgtB/PvdO family nonheme iron enzyme [Candidatus Delongbacteria bacterium]|nr:SUMF1/EgtB/PvdO family nonheme iron enzyme [Candidatus Delongbacteria bacterium]MBN2834493.1 SUMF1/EgtB/PvdO family nonheme iron enzyme [Candidatus Delongbacteria bacterium]